MLTRRIDAATLSRLPGRVRKFHTVKHIVSLDINQNYKRDRKTKICATVGPKTSGVEEISMLLNAGMNIMRLNCSHGTHDFYRQTIDNLKTAIASVKR